MEMENNNLIIKVDEVELRTTISSLRGLFGISCIKWYQDERLDWYISEILKYLNKSLILSGACTVLQRLQEFTSIYEDGTELILEDMTRDLEFKVGLDTGKEHYRTELFVFAWSNIMTSLYMTLSYNYSGIFETSESTDCHDTCNNCAEHLGLVDSLGGSGNWESSKYSSGCGCGK